MAEFIIERKKSQTRYFTEDLGSDIGLDMILIPGGTFLMGSPPDELERYDDESPQHSVTVPTFFMGRYPVTQAQWRVVASFPQVNRELKPDPSDFKGDNRPVESVSWYDAVEFCQRLSPYTNRSYRLPTEAEWEYACRAGATTPFHFGETITAELANYDATEIYGNGVKGEYRQETTPVDHFGIANAFGLCDMHGNVWEWCLDHWHGNYEGAPNDGSTWLTDDESAGRVRRGGSWIYFPRDCRCASRFNDNPDSDLDGIGFRVVCEYPRISQSYSDLGGIDGLLKSGVFDSEGQLLGVLETCKDYALPGHEADGLRETIFLNYGAVEQHLDAVFELDLVRYVDTEFYDPDYGYEEGGWLELTELGKKFIEEIKNQKNNH
jgi:formylglycine-generating enzyme required for sulfatase activity